MKIYLGRNPHEAEGFKVTLDDGTDITNELLVSALEVSVRNHDLPTVRLELCADVEVEIDEGTLRVESKRGPVLSINLAKLS
jgi:hypothetical protein